MAMAGPAGSVRPARTISPPGVMSAALVGAGLALPFLRVKANRLVPGEPLRLPEALAVLPAGAGWVALALLVALALVALPGQVGARGRAVAGALGVVLGAVLLGLAARGLVAAAAPPAGGGGAAMARVSPASGFWLVVLGFGLMAGDGLSRLRPGPVQGWILLAAAVAVAIGLPASGVLDAVSVMVEHAARAEAFSRALREHLVLAFGSSALALAAGLPLGVALFLRPRWRGAVLGVLNMVQTVPSLALFGLLIPLLGALARHVPGLAALGVAGIGPFPALVALFLYALLPVVANTLAGLLAVPASVREAARGLGMTRAQRLVQVELALALPMILAALRIALVQNIGLAVIAGLIGGGGFGSFVFQGLNQTAMDLVLLGALPTILLALVAGIGLDLAIRSLGPQGGRAP